MTVKEFITVLIDEGHSQSAIARKSGVSQPTVNRMWLGDTKNVSLETITKIAIAYSKPLSFFLTDLEPQPSALTLSDSDVDRIADAVVAKLQSVLTLT